MNISFPQTGLRPTLDELCENTRLLTRLRWVAGNSILGGALFAYFVLDIDLHIIELIIIGISVLVYNWALSRLCAAEGKTIRRAWRVAWGQILLDWLAMLALVHFTGGITSPALIYFVIHAAISGTVLLPWHVRALALLVVLMVGGLALLERTGTLPHAPLHELGLNGGLYKNGTYTLAVMFFFGTTVITLSELVSARSQRLRHREQRIRQLYEARATFVRAATHELRAPLAAGISLMHNLEQGYLGDLNEQQMAILTRVTSRLEGLRTLVDDLLDLASIREASMANVPLEPVSVLETLKSVIERETPTADEKHLVMSSELGPDDTIVLAGESGLVVIFGNLLNNAIKYTPDGGQVTVSYTLNRAAQTAEITFRDTGIGIPADEQPRIFGEFFRTRNAKNALIPGTGIGLSTVRMLVERYGGTLTMQSEEGRGSTFTVTLPLAPRQIKHSARQT